MVERWLWSWSVNSDGSRTSVCVCVWTESLISSVVVSLWVTAWSDFFCGYVAKCHSLKCVVVWLDISFPLGFWHATVNELVCELWCWGSSGVSESETSAIFYTLLPRPTLRHWCLCCFQGKKPLQTEKARRSIHVMHLNEEFICFCVCLRDWDWRLQLIWFYGHRTAYSIGETHTTRDTVSANNLKESEIQTFNF